MALILLFFLAMIKRITLISSLFLIPVSFAELLEVHRVENKLAPISQVAAACLEDGTEGFDVESFNPGEYIDFVKGYVSNDEFEEFDATVDFSKGFFRFRCKVSRSDLLPMLEVTSPRHTNYISKDGVISVSSRSNTIDVNIFVAVSEELRYLTYKDLPTYDPEGPLFRIISDEEAQALDATYAPYLSRIASFFEESGIQISYAGLELPEGLQFIDGLIEISAQDQGRKGAGLVKHFSKVSIRSSGQLIDAVNAEAVRLPLKIDKKFFVESPSAD